MRKAIKYTFRLSVIVLVLSVFAGCFPATKAAVRASKGPKDYVIKSVDSAFLTDQNYAVVYTTVSIKGKDKVQVATFKVQKTGEGKALDGYTPYATMDNATYKTEVQGNIVKQFITTTNSGDIFNGSGKPAILIEGNLPNKRVLLSVYAYPNLPDWGRYAIALEPQVKTRRPYMYALLPATVATDVALTGAGIGVGVIAAVVYGIRAIFV